jgi:hypothetical protein
VLATVLERVSHITSPTSMLQSKNVVWPVLLTLHLGAHLLHASPVVVESAKDVRTSPVHPPPQGLRAHVLSLFGHKHDNGEDRDPIDHYAITKPDSKQTYAPWNTQNELINMARHSPRAAKEVNQRRKQQLQTGMVAKYPKEKKSEFWREYANDQIGEIALRRINKKGEVVQAHHNGELKLYHHPYMKGEHVLSKFANDDVHHMKYVEPRQKKADARKPNGTMFDLNNDPPDSMDTGGPSSADERGRGGKMSRKARSDNARTVYRAKKARDRMVLKDRGARHQPY